MNEAFNSERIQDIEKDIEITARLLGALGLYDAANDFYPTTHHDDESWCIRGRE